MKLLLVEDDRMTAALVRRALHEDGHAVDVASSVREARSRALADRYDAIVADVGLPDASGLDLVHWLRAEQRATPVLLLTGADAPEDIVRGLDTGADDYLTKPFDVLVLKARVRALLRRGGSPRADALSFAGITLDRRRHEAVFETARLRLTPREFALLEYLVLHAEAVATRTELLEKVWEMQFDPGSNVVDVHIARLRSKLRAAGARARLVTLRGAGFVLTARPDAATAAAPGDRSTS